MIMLLAMITMFIDHVGAAFYPEADWLRIIGRVAFPLYALGIVQGYRHTSNLPRYFLRLSVLAIISQLPYVLLFNVQQLNVIFLFLVALLSLYLVDHFKKSISVPFVFCLAFLVSPFIEYGVYGIALVFIYRYASGRNILLAHFVLSGIYLLLFREGFYIQFCATAASALIVYKDKWLAYPVRINRQFYRAFYPAHLAILFIVGEFI